MLQNDEQLPTHSFTLTLKEAGDEHTPIISAEKLKELYTLAARLRAAARKRKSRTAKARGPQFGEACEVAAVIDLRPGDTVAILASQRVAMLALSDHRSGQRQENCTPKWSVLESGDRERLAIAAGIAFAHKTERRKSVIVAFATSSEIAGAADSIHFAHEQSLPIIYLERPPAHTRKSRPTPHRVPIIPVDKNDAVAVYRVVYEAIDKARRGAGATLIRCVQQTISAKGRGEDERVDPIAYMEHYLRKRNLWTDDLRF